MNYVLSVAVVDSKENLFNNHGGTSLSEGLVFIDDIEELTPIAKLCDEQDTWLTFKYLEKTDDVWMIQVAKDVNLIL